MWIIYVFVSCVSHTFASVHCCLMVTFWDRADVLALVGGVYCIFVTFPCGILGQVWYLIVLFPNLCVFLTYIWLLVCYRSYVNTSVMPKLFYFPRAMSLSVYIDSSRSPK